MPSTPPEVDIQRLSVAQRLELIFRLWDSIPDAAETLPVPEWHRQELEQRLAAADADPTAAVPWEQVKGRVKVSGTPGL